MNEIRFGRAPDLDLESTKMSWNVERSLQEQVEHPTAAFERGYSSKRVPLEPCIRIKGKLNGKDKRIVKDGGCITNMLSWDIINKIRSELVDRLTVKDFCSCHSKMEPKSYWWNVLEKWSLKLKVIATLLIGLWVCSLGCDSRNACTCLTRRKHGMYRDKFHVDGWFRGDC